MWRVCLFSYFILASQAWLTPFHSCNAGEDSKVSAGRLAGLSMQARWIVMDGWTDGPVVYQVSEERETRDDSSIERCRRKLSMLHLDVPMAIVWLSLK